MKNCIARATKGILGELKVDMVVQKETTQCNKKQRLKLV